MMRSNGRPFNALAGQTDPSKLKRYYDLSDAKIALDYHRSTFLTTFAKFITWRDKSYLSVQLALIGGFIVFVVVNKGVVVGDSTAHETAIHLPQLLYFLLFYGVFALPYFLAKLPSTLKLIFTNKRNVLIVAISFAVIVQLNTIVNPYLLNDERHYTFYVWNRWFGRYRYAALATVPVSVFLLFSLYDNLKDLNCVSFLIPYCISTLLVLSLQRMIEVRYFLVPYLIARHRFVQPSNKIIIGGYSTVHIMHHQKYFLALDIVLVGYFGVSQLVFDQVYTTAPLVIDELYHLPQGTLMCEGNYSYWNPKITTLPGLYLVSESLISSYFSCNAYNLRFVNLIGSCINLLLFSSMLNAVYGTQTRSPYIIVLQALNLSILPPLYFFTHVYYTDIWSLTFLLTYTRICFGNGEQSLMILFGFWAILMRQTNVAWIGMIYLHK